MKCVIIALALLCSAQALKMDRTPRSIRAQKHVDKFDAIDRKAGLPERSKMDRAEWKKKAAEFTGSADSIGNGIADEMFSYARGYGLAGDITSCAASHSDSADIMLCVADEMVSSNAMGISDIICDEVDAYNTNAADVLHEALEGAVEEAEKGFEDAIAYAKADKRLPFDYYAKTVTRMDDYLDFHGVVTYVQGELDSYTSYCDDIASGAGAELIESNGITGSANTEAGLKSLVKTNVADDDMGGAGSFAEGLKTDYNNWALMKIPEHIESLFHTDVLTRKQKHANRNKWRKGQFRRIGRRPR